MAALIFVPMAAATSLEVLPMEFGGTRDTPSSSPLVEGLTGGFLSANMSSISFATPGGEGLLSLSDSAFLLAFFLPMERFVDLVALNFLWSGRRGDPASTADQRKERSAKDAFPEFRAINQAQLECWTMESKELIVVVG